MFLFPSSCALAFSPPSLPSSVQWSLLSSSPHILDRAGMHLTHWLTFISSVHCGTTSLAPQQHRVSSSMLHPRHQILCPCLPQLFSFSGISSTLKWLQVKSPLSELGNRSILLSWHKEVRRWKQGLYPNLCTISFHVSCLRWLAST